MNILCLHYTIKIWHYKFYCSNIYNIKVHAAGQETNFISKIELTTYLLVVGESVFHVWQCNNGNFQIKFYILFEIKYLLRKCWHSGTKLSRRRLTRG